MKPKSIPNPKPNPNVQDVAKPTWAHPNVQDVEKPTWAHPNVRDVAKPVWANFFFGRGFNLEKFCY